MNDDLDNFFAELTAPLEPLLIQPPASPAVESAPINLEPGHFLSEYDNQISFFEKSRGGVADRSLLEAMLGAPYHVLPGQRFFLCGRHVLAVDAIIDPPHRWVELLIDNRIFVPWPDVLAADIFHHTAPPVVMVHPDRYIAGTILNYYVARHGAEAIEMIMQQQARRS